VVESLRVLLVEDVEMDAELVRRELSAKGRPVHIERVENAEAMRTALRVSPWDVILCDFSLPSFSAPEALVVAKKARPDLPFIVVSGTVGEEAAAEVMRAGAHDFILKDRLSRLLPAIERELRDRTERKRAQAALRESEEQLRQAQKMEAVGTLTAGIAHDFNNLLSVILCYGEVLAEDLAPNDPAREGLGEIQAAGKRASDLTRQLLAFGRTQILEPRVVDLDEIVTGSEKLLRRVLEADIEFSVTLGRSVNKVFADPGQIDQVIMNLVINARDAMPQGGKLAIETSNVVLDAEAAGQHSGAAPGRYVTLAVRDTGVGMDAATRARIFEPFFTTKERGKGTGLGLPIVSGIVAQSGARICVSSEPGKGTTFTIYFPPPSDSALSMSPPAAEEVTPPRGDETLLLVEDDWAVRNVMRSILTRLGYHVLEAQGSGDALLISEQYEGTIHLLLTDVVMPRMSGPQLAERLRARAPEMKVLFVTGNVDASTVRHGVVGPGRALLQKPITPMKMAIKMRELLDQGRSAR
jgi:two-component system cell cycle sensor histidine kinase/response regulator CckA